MKNPLMDDQMTDEGFDIVRLAVISTGMLELFVPPIVQAIWVPAALWVLWKTGDLEWSLRLLRDRDA